MPFAHPRVFRFGIGLMVAVIGGLCLFAGGIAMLALVVTGRDDLPQLPGLIAFALPAGALGLWIGRRLMRRASQ